MTSRYVTPIAVELLVREAGSLRGYAAGDWRTKRLVEIYEELIRLGAPDVLDQIDDEDDEPPDLNPEGDPTRNGAFG